MKRDNLPSDHPTNRREFIQGVGVTFAVGATGIVGACTMEAGPEATREASAPINEAISPNAWVSIGADDAITIQFGGTEMGQGTMTSLPLVLAEELDADWENVRVETVATHDPTYGNPRAFGYYGFPILYTAGSQTLRGYFTANAPGGRAGAQVPDRGGRRGMGSTCRGRSDRAQPRRAPADRSQLELRRNCRLRGSPGDPARGR